MNRERYLERTRALVPDLRGRAQQAETQRRLPDPLPFARLQLDPDGGPGDLFV